MTAKDITEEVVGYIVRRLKELLGADERAFRGYMTMLEILSENRDLQAQVREAERMLTQVDVRRLPSYELGYEAGAAEGEARGEAESKRAIVRQLLRRLEPAQVAELLDLTAEADAAPSGLAVQPCRIAAACRHRGSLRTRPRRARRLVDHR